MNPMFPKKLWYWTGRGERRLRHQSYGVKSFFSNASFILSAAIWSLQRPIIAKIIGKIVIFYRGIHEKGLGDVVTAVCYTIYLSLGPQTAEETSPEPFS